MTAYASQSDLELRYPDELILLAADENDGSVDADRVAGRWRPPARKSVASSRPAMAAMI